MTATITWEPRTAVWFALREDGESQSSLANRAGIDPSKLSRILSGEAKKFDIADLARIAKAQGRDLDYYTEPPIIHGRSRGAWVDRPMGILTGYGSLAAA